jgi:signal transduction histidine kinase
MAMDLEELPTPPEAISIEAMENCIHLALRLVASQASSLTGGGTGLLFTSPSPDGASPPQVRAAAGFDSPEEARRVAYELAALARETLSSGQAQSAAALDTLENRGGGGTLALPLIVRTRVLGVLIVSHVATLSAAHREALEALAWSAAVQLDHPNLTTEFDGLRLEWEEHRAMADEKSDELLKLSEDLFAQDIELLRNNEKLGKIEKLKNDFIEKMSRELRTPLNSIIEATISVLAGENENLSEDSQQMLRRALDEGAAFQRTLENILDLWRIKQNELPIETQEFCFADIIDESIFSVQDTLGDKPVEILKELPEPLPRIRGDLAKINQILFLLLDNAAKFIERGTITISARLMDERLHCSIKDTGIGICADDQPHVWNEFYQVDDRSSIKYRGAGLGLTLVHDLLVLLDGDSVLESEPGIGTVVEFSVPVVLA